jgi:hypothetical protein
VNRSSAEFVFLGLFITGMIFSMRFSPVWYTNLPLVGLFLYLWYISKERHEFIPVMLICGELSCAAAWYGSLWVTWIIQSAVIGLFLFKLNIQNTRPELTSFLIITGIFLVVTILTDQVNHTIIPVILVVFASLLGILYSIISEFRLRKEYIGEKL